MNKKAKTSGLAVFGVIAIVGVFILLMVIAFGGKLGITGQSVVSTTGAEPSTTTGGAGVTVYGANPTVTYASTDAQQPSKVVGGTQTVWLNGQLQSSAPSSASVGDKLTVLFINGTASTASYHNAKVVDYVVKGGANVVPITSDANGTLTVQLRNTNGVVMTSGGTGTNQSSTASNGETLNLEVRMNGQSLASTGDLRCYVEVNSSTKYDMSATGTSLSIKDASVQNVAAPKGYSTLAGGSYKAYDISAFKDGNINIGTLNLKAATGQTLAGTKFIVTCYGKEWFNDQLYGLTYGIEDSSGTSKAIAVNAATYYVI